MTKVEDGEDQLISAFIAADRTFFPGRVSDDPGIPSIIIHPPQDVASVREDVEAVSLDIERAGDIYREADERAMGILVRTLEERNRERGMRSGKLFRKYADQEVAAHEPKGDRSTKLFSGSSR